MERRGDEGRESIGGKREEEEGGGWGKRKEGEREEGGRSKDLVGIGIKGEG